MIKDFEKKYGVDIRLSTFNDADEALTKIASEEPRVRPLLPELRLAGPAGPGRPAPAAQPRLPAPTPPTCGPASATPGTTGAARYTAPYTDLQHRDRLAHRHGPRRHRRAATTPTTCFWDTAYAGNLAILDDWHTAIAMVLLRNGQLRHQQHRSRRHRDGPRAAARAARHDAPEGDDQHVHRHAGRAVRPVPDVVRATRSTPRTTCRRARPSDIMRYWFPEDGRGEVDNDLVVCLAQGKNPVAAHFFINDLMDDKIAETNFGFTGYQPPLTAFTPETLVAKGYVPENLASAVVHRAGLHDRRAAAAAAAGRGRRVPPHLAGVQGRWLSGAPRGRDPLPVAAAGDPRHRLARRPAGRAALRRAGDPVRRRRPDPAPAGAGLEPARLGRRAVRVRLAAHRRAGRLLPARAGPHRRVRRGGQPAVPGDRLPGGLLHGPVRRAGGRACCSPP